MVKNADDTRGARDWDAAADPTSTAFRYSNVDRLRTDPLSRFNDYIGGERSKVKPETRDVVDASMHEALTGRVTQLQNVIAAAKPSENTAAAKAQLTTAQGQLAKLTDAKVKSAPAAAGLSGGARVNDPRVNSMLASLPTQQSGITTMTADQARAEDAQLRRPVGVKVSEKQLQLWARMRARGDITDAQLEAARTTGTTFVPPKVEWKTTDMGGGVALQTSTQGQNRIIDTGGGKPGTGAGAAAGAMVEKLGALLESQGQAEKGKGLAMAYQAMQVVASDPDGASVRLGANVRSASGGLNYKVLSDPNAIAFMAEERAKAAANNNDIRESITGPTSSGLGGIPRADGQQVIDLTHLFSGQ
jgi:hypothetical protein